MAVFIAEQIRDDFETFFPSNRTAEFSRKASDAWTELTSQLNASFGSSVTEVQVREKWHNMKRESKKKYAAEQKYQRGTGGGPSMSERNQNDSVHSAIIECFGSTSAFNGVAGGSSTDIFGVPPPKSPKLEGRKFFDFNNTQIKMDTSVQELQKQVLEISLTNQQHISRSLEKVDKLVDHASSVIGLMENLL
uniref:Regulatory protein zeste n=1 Tax=Meloidogyne hapla TaxID=6305 RepID=A0A1I8B0Y8_MELHA